MSGVTYRFRGSPVRPVLTKDDPAERLAVEVPERGGAWIECDWTEAVAADPSIGEGRFADMFAEWGLADLEGWYQNRDDRPFDSYAKARFWAHRR
jgi:hypothetical protein